MVDSVTKANGYKIVLIFVTEAIMSIPLGLAVMLGIVILVLPAGFGPQFVGVGPAMFEADGIGWAYSMATAIQGLFVASWGIALATRLLSKTARTLTKEGFSVKQHDATVELRAAE